MDEPLRIERLDERQAAIYRGMTGAQRLAIANGIWRSVRTITEAAVRSRHPDYDDDQVARSVAELMSRGTG